MYSQTSLSFSAAQGSIGGKLLFYFHGILRCKFFANVLDVLGNGTKQASKYIYLTRHARTN